MNRLEELKSKFDIAEPIFDYELAEMGFSDEDIKDTLVENVFEELFGVDYVPCRIFYIVGYSEFFNLYTKLDKNSLSIIFKYFVGSDFEYGYLYGFCSLNKLRLSNQVCFSYVVKSCRATNKLVIDTIEILPEECNLDYKLIMCVDAFKRYRDAFDCTLNSAINSIKLFLNDLQFDLFMEEIK